MTVDAHLVERHAGVVDLAVRTRPGVRSYTFGASVDLDTAYAGTTAMFTVDAGAAFRSQSLRRSRRNLVEESNRGLTRVAYDPADYVSAAVPGDATVSFVRVNPIDNAGNPLGEGSILVVPPPGFFGTGRRVLPLSGTAPNVTALTSGVPPQTSMVINLPKFADDIQIFNDGGDPIFVAFGPGDLEVEVPSGSTEPLVIYQAGVSEIYLRGDGGSSAFRIFASLVQGIQA